MEELDLTFVDLPNPYLDNQDIFENQTCININDKTNLFIIDNDVSVHIEGNHVSMGAMNLGKFSGTSENLVVENIALDPENLNSLDTETPNFASDEVFQSSSYLEILTLFRQSINL